LFPRYGLLLALAAVVVLPSPPPVIQEGNQEKDLDCECEGWGESRGSFSDPQPEGERDDGGGSSITWTTFPLEKQRAKQPNDRWGAMILSGKERTLARRVLGLYSEVLRVWSSRGERGGADGTPGMGVGEREWYIDWWIEWDDLLATRDEEEWWLEASRPCISPLTATPPVGTGEHEPLVQLLPQEESSQPDPYSTTSSSPPSDSLLSRAPWWGCGLGYEVMNGSPEDAACGGYFSLIDREMGMMSVGEGGILDPNAEDRRGDNEWRDETIGS
jgi:hypothetical protein